MKGNGESSSVGVTLTSDEHHHEDAANHDEEEDDSSYLTALCRNELAESAASHGLPGRGSNRLYANHLVEFPSNGTTLDRIARVVCRVGKIPRKEVWEAWAVARLVYAHYWERRRKHQQQQQRQPCLPPFTPRITRIADVAAGHGLLSWIVLILHAEATSLNTHDDDDDYDSSTSSSPPPLSAVCIDKNMPATADRLHEEMLHVWPMLQDAWDYVEGPLEGITTASPDVLLLGVHACGSLTDKILNQALTSRNNVALLPCCHSRKCLPSSANLMESSVLQSPLALSLLQNNNITEYLDTWRIQRLRDAGWQVTECRIPECITPKNRLLLARVTTHAKTPSIPLLPKQEDEKTKQLLAWKQKLPTLRFSLADTPEARQWVRQIAGRAAAQARRQPSPIALGLCIVLCGASSSNNTTTEMTVDTLQPWIAGIVQDASRVTVTNTNGSTTPYYDATNNVYTRTVNVTYLDIFDKTTARFWHAQIINALPVQYPGCSVKHRTPKSKSIPLEMFVFYLPTTFNQPQQPNNDKNDDGQDTLSSQIQSAAESLLSNDVSYKIQLITKRQPYQCPDGRLGRIYRVSYNGVESEEKALEYHDRLIEGLGRHIPDVSASLWKRVRGKKQNDA